MLVCVGTPRSVFATVHLQPGTSSGTTKQASQSRGLLVDIQMPGMHNVLCAGLSYAFRPAQCFPCTQPTLGCDDLHSLTVQIGLRT